jgi:abhydrolase domain-containing protein 17
MLAGQPAEDFCYADIEAAYKFLRSDLRVPAKNIVLYGRSLGSGPSCHLAAQSAQSEDPLLKGPVGGVILHAPFLSVYRIVLDTGCTIYGDKFPNVDYLPMIKSPLILCHGTADQIVPFNHSERLFEALPEDCRAKPLYIEGMGHNNVHSQVRPMFVSRLNEYLDEHVRSKIKGNSLGTARLTKALPYGTEDDVQGGALNYAMSVFAGGETTTARRRR